MLTFFDKAWLGAVIGPIAGWIAGKFGLDAGALQTVLVGLATFAGIYLIPNKA